MRWWWVCAAVGVGAAHAQSIPLQENGQISVPGSPPRNLNPSEVGVPWGQHYVFTPTEFQGFAASKLDLNPLAQYLGQNQTVAALIAGTIDAQPALVRALNAGPVLLPCGTYLLSEPLVFGPTSQVNLDGRGPGCVVFNVGFASGDVVTFTGTLRPRIANVTFNASVQRTSGAVVHTLGTYGALFQNVVLSGTNAGDGWLVDSASNTTHIDDFDCRPPGTATLGVFYAGACIHGTGNFADLHFTHGNAASWNYGLQLTYGSGVYGEDFDVVEGGTALDFNPGSGQKVFGVNIAAFYADTSAGNGILFEGTGAISDVQLSQPWSSNSQTANGLVTSNAALNGLQVTSATILNNYGAGLDLLQGTNISITAPHSMMNSRQASGVWDEIYVGAGQSNVISITDPVVGAGGTGLALGETSQARYGVNVPGGNASGQTVTVRGIEGQGLVTGLCNITPDAYPNHIVTSGSATTCIVPWAQLTEAVTATTGTITTASAIERYTKDGSRLTLTVNAGITTNGSGSGGVVVALPFQASATGYSILTGRDVLTGKALTGTIAPSGNSMTVQFYDNSYPGANGAALVLSGTYETVN